MKNLCDFVFITTHLGVIPNDSCFYFINNYKLICCDFFMFKGTNIVIKFRKTTIGYRIGQIQKNRKRK